MKVCGATAAPLVACVNVSCDGLIVTGVVAVVPTVKVTAIVFGLLVAPGEVMMMLPLYVPGASPVPLAFTVIVAGVELDDGMA